MKKHSASIGSATPDPNRQGAAAASVPPPAIANKPAPGKKGPIGTAPRTTYSRVNTGTPPTPDSGVTSQKQQAPRGMEFLIKKTGHVEDSMTTTMMGKPTVQTMIKSAMEGTISKVQLSAEAARQMANQGHADEEEKTASAQSDHIPTAQLEKLADAVAFIAKQAESGNIQAPGKGPNALEVLEAPGGENPAEAGQMGSATQKHQPPKTPATQTEEVQQGKANTGLETNDGMSHPEQPTDPWSNEKAKLSAAAQRIMKVASGEKPDSTVELIRKLAEDANNPAQISGGGTHKADALPEGASASEEGVPSEPSDVSSQKSMISSNQAAIDYKKGKAKADPKKDVNRVLTEPALTSSTDKVLQKVLDNTSKAGVKISSAMNEDVVKVAAARARLMKIAEKCESKKSKKKTSGMGGDPAAASGGVGGAAANVAPVM